ncbi:hypothetical protein H8959_009042 [Pygathrix nigripes]
MNRPYICLELGAEQPANNQGQSTLQPLPPSHKQHSAQHHPSITSLNRNSLTNRRNQSPAPPAALPAELQTTPESVQLQDSWVLGSNVPLESRVSIRLGEKELSPQKSQKIESS